MSTTQVGIRLSLEGAAQVDAGLQRVQGGMKGIGTAAESVRSALGGLAGAFAGAISVGAFVQAADAVTVLNNQLKLATGSTRAAGQAYEALFDIAQRSRVSFTELGSTYASIARAGESLGLSQQRLLGVTEAIGNAMTISGGSAAGMQAALTQLGQGLASGQLRGEELNSVMEQTPRLAKALADGLGVTTGQLREMGKAGQLSAEQVIKALESQAATLRGEVAGATLTVGQAMTQVQNSAIMLVGEIDRVSGSSGRLAVEAQAASESLSNIARAFRDVDAAGRPVSVFGDAIAVVFETVAVLGANVGYVIRQIGIEMGGLAAQAVAIGKGDFSGAREIGRLMREDAEKARRDVDALTARILAARGQAEQVQRSMQGVDTRAEDARLNRQAGNAQQAASAFAKSSTSAGAAKKAVDEFAQSAERGAKAVAAMAAKDAGLSPEFASAWADLSAARQKDLISLDQLTAAQADLLAKQPAMVAAAQAQAQAAQAAEQLAAAEADRINALERSAGSAAERLQSMQREDQATALAAAQNISLAQAIEEVAIARLREQQAAEMSYGNEAAAQAIQREIDARKQLASAIGSKEARAASEQSAKDAASDWQRTAQRIEQDLTDALMRGFESGKGFADNLKDTLVNMFKTMVLRPIIQAVVSPVAGAVTGAMGFAGAANASSAGGSVMNMVSGASSINTMWSAAAGGISNFGTTSIANTVGAMGGDSLGTLAALKGGGSSTMGAIGGAANALGGAMLGFMAGKIISGGYSAIGKSGNTAVAVGTAAGAAIGSIVPVIGTAIGAFVGGVIGGVVNVAFGRKLKETGITGTFGGESGFEGSQYKYEKGGWFRSNKTTHSALDEDTADFLRGSFNQLRGSAALMAATLGGADDAIGKFTAGFRLNIKGLSDEQITKNLEAEFKKMGEGLARTALDAMFEQQGVAARSVVLPGETAAETLTRLSSSLVTVNAAFDTLGATLLSASLQSADLAADLIAAFGGIDQFKQATQSYYANFYTDAEKLDTAARQLGATFEGLGITLPATKEAFRQLVEAQDLTTESGRSTYAALLSLSGAFSEISNAADQAARALANTNQGIRDRIDVLNGSQTQRSLQLRDAGDVTTQTLLSQLFASEDLQAANAAVTAAEEALAEARLASASAAAESAQAAIESTFAAKNAAIDAQRATAEASRSAAQDLIGELQAVFDTLQSSVRDLYQDVLSTAAMSAAAGRQFIDSALASARATGYLPDNKALGDAIGATRSGMGEEQYASAVDRDRDRLVLAGKLSELAGIAQPQLSAAERALKVAESQLEALDIQSRLLKDLQDAAKEQNDLARGLGGKVDAVPAALKTLQDALVAQMQAQTATLAASLVAAVSTGATKPQDAVKAFEKQTGASVAKDTWVNAGGTQVWASEGGAMAVGGSAAKGVVPTDGRAATIYGVQGQSITVGGAQDFIAAAIASGDLRSIYDGAIAYGLSSSAVDALAGFAPGSSLKWAIANGLPAFAVGTNYVPRDMIAQIHEGEAIVPKAYNPAANPGMGGGNTERLERLVESLTAEVQRLQTVVATGNRHAERTATVLDDAARGKQPLITEAA